MKNLSHGTSFSRDLPLLIHRSWEAVIPSVLALSDTGQNDLLGGCRVRQSMVSSSSTRACPDSNKIKKKKWSVQGFCRGRAKSIIPVKPNSSGKALSREGKRFCAEV